MSESSREAAAVDRARAMFAEQQLPFPPIPDGLARRLRPLGTRVFTTIDHKYSPYALGAYAGPMVYGAPSEDYAVIGFDGHGVNSWAVHYYLVEPGLALFVQMPWGGAYSNPDDDRPPIEHVFGWAGRLRDAMGRAHATGRIPHGCRLVVVVTRWSGSGWGWVPSSPEAAQTKRAGWRMPSAPPGAHSITWREDGDVTGPALNAVMDLIKQATA